MIAHLLSHPVGLVHVVAAIVALGLGAAVLVRRKGDRRHRWVGRAYLVTMLAMNITALLDFELYGRFGPFHWMALISLASVAGGQVAAWRKLSGWQYRHAYMMVGSYVGLVAAAVAEVASRIPDWPFGPAVIISSVLVISGGIWMMLRMIPASVAEIVSRRRHPGLK